MFYLSKTKCCFYNQDWVKFVCSYLQEPKLRQIIGLFNQIYLFIQFVGRFDFMYSHCLKSILRSMDFRCVLKNIFFPKCFWKSNFGFEFKCLKSDLFGNPTVFECLKIHTWTHKIMKFRQFWISDIYCTVKCWKPKIQNPNSAEIRTGH